VIFTFVIWTNVGSDSVNEQQVFHRLDFIIRYWSYLAVSTVKILVVAL
jgi:hypothetical protein